MSYHDRRPGTGTFPDSPLIYRAIHEAQVTGINAILRQKPAPWEMPDRTLTKTELVTRAFVMEQRAVRLQTVDPDRLTNVRDHDSILHMTYNWLGNWQQKNIFAISIFGGSFASSKFYLDNPMQGDTVSVQIAASGEKPFSGVDTENAMAIAEGLFDAIVKPLEDAHELPPLPDVSQNPKLIAMLQTLAA